MSSYSTQPDRLLDFPVIAYERAENALGEFEALAAEYILILDTQRIMLATGDTAGIAQMTTRADSLARSVQHCGRRIAPVREALEQGSYSGERTEALARHIVECENRATAIGTLVIQIAAVCAAKRERAATTMNAERTKHGSAARSHSAYTRSARAALAIDVTR